MLFSVFAFGMMMEARAVTYTNPVTEGASVTLSGKQVVATVSSDYTLKFTAKTVAGTGPWTITWTVVVTVAGVEAAAVDNGQTMLLDPATAVSFDLLMSMAVACPTPVADYLTAIATALTGYTASGTTLTMGDTTNGIVSTYDAGSGLITSYKYYVSGVLVLDLSSGGIPGYDLPILLGITAIGVIGMIYVMRKKK